MPITGVIVDNIYSQLSSLPVENLIFCDYFMRNAGRFTDISAFLQRIIPIFCAWYIVRTTGPLMCRAHHYSPGLTCVTSQGHVVQANPVDGCTPLAPPPDTNISELPWIVIIRRKPCRFVTKVRFLFLIRLRLLSRVTYTHAACMNSHLHTVGAVSVSRVTTPGAISMQLEIEYLSQFWSWELVKV